MPLPLASLDSRRAAKRQQGRARAQARVGRLEEKLAKARAVVTQIENELVLARADAAWIHPLDQEAK